MATVSILPGRMRFKRQTKQSSKVIAANRTPSLSGETAIVVTHPSTGETVWFNHAHMFHVSNLEAKVRESLLREFTEEYLPRNAYYGDGSKIESSILEEIRETYYQTAVTFKWEKGDVLLLDNILASHGREPFVGPRKVLVA